MGTEDGKLHTGCLLVLVLILLFLGAAFPSLQEAWELARGEQSDGVWSALAPGLLKGLLAVGIGVGVLLLVTLIRRESLAVFGKQLLEGLFMWLVFGVLLGLVAGVALLIFSARG